MRFSLILTATVDEAPASAHAGGGPGRVGVRSVPAGGRGARRDERVRRTPGTAGHHARPARHLPKSGGQATTRPRRTTAARVRPGPAGRRAGRRRRRRGRPAPPAPGRAGRASPGPPRRRAPSASTGRQADLLVQGEHLAADQAVRQHSAGVGAGVDRRRRPRAPTAASRPPRACRAAHVRGVRRELRAGLLGVRREVVDLHPGRHQRGALPGHRGDHVVGQRRCRARCSRCRRRPGRRPTARRSSARSPGRRARARRAIAAAATSAGQQGVRSPASRSIQSPTSLTQPSPRAAWVSTSATRSAGSISAP